MAEKLRLRSNGNGDVYMYVEDSSTASFAAGGDDANNVFAMNTSVSADVMPDGPTANLTFAPGANGDITLRPHGTGDTLFAVGDIDINAGNIILPRTNAALTEGVIKDGTIRLIHFQSPDRTNAFLGPNAGSADADSDCTGVGVSALTSLALTGTDNTAVGSQSGSSITTGNANTLIGTDAGLSIVAQQRNVIIGAFAYTNASGDRNVIFGHSSGSSYTGSENNNILIGDSTSGTLGDASILRIGGGSGTGNGLIAKAFIAGIHNVTPAGATETMIIDASGQMGSTSAGGGASDFVTDSGTATQVAGIIDMLGGSNLGSTGAGNSVTFNLDDTVSISGSMTAGTGLTATTGDVTATAGDVVATAGDLIATSGLLAMPVTSDAIDEGAITLGGGFAFHGRGTDNIFAGVAAGNATFTVAGSESNAVFGFSAMNTMATNCRNNVVVGYKAMDAVTDSRSTTSVGYNSLLVMTTQLANTVVGASGMAAATTGAGFNTAIGSSALSVITTGAYNCALGNSAGITLATTDSDNICIMNAGTATDNNTIRIGTQGTGNGQQDTAFMAGIYNVAPTNDGMVIISSAGQLGSQLNLVLPENPAFLAYNSVDDADQTGNGAAATVDFDTEVFDQGGDFAADAFTAPVDGRYVLSAGVSVNDFTAAALINITLITSNRTYLGTQIDPTAAKDSAGAIFLQISVLADMDALDTATVVVTATGEVGDSNDIMGSASPHETYFSGYLAS